MNNLGRWAYYSAQKHQVPVQSIYLGRYCWVALTPRQRQRIKKKSRKNNDQTIGVY